MILQNLIAKLTSNMMEVQFPYWQLQFIYITLEFLQQITARPVSTGSNYEELSIIYVL